MDIKEFFQQSSGKWLSQRTSHHLANQKSESGKSNLVIETLSKDDPIVVKLCQAHHLDAAEAVCGVQVSWDGTMDSEQKKQTGATLFVLVADPEHPEQGKLLRPIGDAEQPAIGRYVMGRDEALTLITEHPALYSEERIWFASPNLRLRTSTLKRADGFSVATFCSEIRMGGVAAAQGAATANQARS